MISTKTQNSSLNITFSSSLDNIDEAAENTKKFLITHNKGDYVFNAILVMREGLSNAVIHGNQYDENKVVTYYCKLDNHDLIFEITDQGNGFDWKKELKKQQDTTAICGRGLYIMNIYSKSMTYNSIGNHLMLKLNLS